MRILESNFAQLTWVGTLLLVLASFASLWWGLPLFSLPKPTGQYQVGTRTLYLTDPGRGRQLVVQLWYPAQPSGKLARYARSSELGLVHRYQSFIRTNSYQDAPLASGNKSFPVVLFSGMWRGRRTQDTFLTEELASHGYVVAAVDHPGNAARVEMADGKIMRGTMTGLIEVKSGRTASEILQTWNMELGVWTADNHFVLDELERMNVVGWTAGRLDARHVGAVGHSFGGAASLAQLGADPRVICAINMDGWTFAGLEKRRDQNVMLLYEGAYASGELSSGVEGLLDATDQAIVDKSLMQYGGYRAYIKGTQHADFTDATLMSRSQRLTATGPIQGERIRTIVRSLVLSFFDKELKGQGTIPAYPEVIITANNPTQK